MTRPALVNYLRVQCKSEGQVVPNLKAPWRDGTTHLGMSSLDLMQRLAALLPRSRRPAYGLLAERLCERLLRGGQLGKLNVADKSKSLVHTTVTNDGSQSDSAVDLAGSNGSNWPLLSFTDSHEIATQNRRQMTANA